MSRIDTTPLPPVCILGLGLIGGSLLRAVRRNGHAGYGWNRSQAAVHRARERGYDVRSDLDAILTRAETEGALIVVAVPMPAVEEIFARIAKVAPSCPVTDVVSVKGPVAAAAARQGLSDRFVGGHPMAGTAHSGWDAGDADLFDGAVWVVADDPGADPRVRALVEQLAGECGATVIAAGSVEHDAAVARISHLPHLLAEALAIVGAQDDLAARLAAGSFRDGTRVAGTAPALVRAMCEANATALVTALDEAVDLLSAARLALVEDGSTEALVEAGYAAHQRIARVRAGDAPPAPTAS
ncbi:prephenate dehydrogenase [Millisia brevis]|uniref:prephenate dehydrogenase n=1 Tax=Millisia brevis TaxID=264148 RepID=UPI0008366047|nr:prephenate dehydrogenase [Millisia brevis]